MTDVRHSWYSLGLRANKQVARNVTQHYATPGNVFLLEENITKNSLANFFSPSVSFILHPVKERLAKAGYVQCTIL